MVSLLSDSQHKWVGTDFCLIRSHTYPQLFLSQTPLINVAKHLDGCINSIQTYTSESQEIKQAHASLSPDFIALVGVLTRIRDIARRREMVGRPFAIYWSGTGDLKIRAVYHIGHLLSEKELAAF
jgi:hypothetical protein